MALREDKRRTHNWLYSIALVLSVASISQSAFAQVTWKRVGTVSTLNANQLCKTDGQLLICDSTTPTISPSNLVGIGTATPQSLLSLYGGGLAVGSYAATTAIGTGSIIASGNIGVGTSLPLVTLDLSRRTDALALPVGTTGQEPSTPLNGMIRYNTTLTDVEAYIGGYWTTLTTGGSSANIYLGTAASAPDPAASATDLQTGLYTAGAGRVDFTSIGSQIVEISSTGLNVVTGKVGIGTTSPANSLDIATGGGIHISSGTPSSTSAALYNNAGTLTWNGAATAIQGVSTGNCSTCIGVYGSGGSSGGSGVYGTSNSYGVEGVSANGGYGVYGISTANSGTNNTGFGVYGSVSNNGSNYGLAGGYFTNNSTGSGAGVYATITSNNNSGAAVLGSNTPAVNSGINYGGYFLDNSTGGGAGVSAVESGSNNTGYAVQAVNSSSTGWGIYSSGSSPNYFAGKVGIGTTLPSNLFDVSGGVAIGASYVGTNTAPTNGLIVQGNVGIGTTTIPTGPKVAINGSVQVAGTGSEACNAATVGQMRYNASGQYMEICTYP